jgi:hypothetical protein
VAGRGKREEEDEDRPRRSRRDEPDEDEDEPRSRRRRGRDEEDEEEPRGKRRREGKKRAVWPWVLAACLGVVLIGGGALGTWLLLRGGTPSDLAFVPADAQGFITVRVADVWKSDAAQKMVAQLKKMGGPMGDPAAEFEKEFGLALSDIERATMVFADAQKQVLWIIVATSKPYDRQKLLGKVTGAQEVKHEGKSYHLGTVKGDKTAVHFASDRVLVVGSEAGVKRCLSFAAGKRNKGPLDDAIALAGGKHHIVGAANPPLIIPPAEMQKMKAGMAGPGAAFLPLTEVQVATLVLDVSEPMQLEATLRFPAPPKAQDAKKAIDNGLNVAKLFLPTLEQQFGRALAGAPGMGGEGKKLFAQIKATLDAIVVEQKGADVVVRAKTEAAGAVIGVALLLPAVQKVRGAATRAQSSNNLRQLALAMINYADSHGGQLPPAVIRGKDGKPLYSWRVELLPYLEQHALYNEFHKDEAWNSAHNFKLLTRMPRVFALPGQNVPGLSHTPYQVFTGPGTLFTGPMGTRYPAGIPDGTSNTILIAEASRPVPWTAPEDITYRPAQPVKPLLGSRNGSYTVAMADGTVRSVRPTVGEKTLHAAVTPAGGEVLGPDW